MFLLGFGEHKKSDGSREGVLSPLLLLQPGGPGSQKRFPQATLPLMGGVRDPCSISDLVRCRVRRTEVSLCPRPFCLALCLPRSDRPHQTPTLSPIQAQSQTLCCLKEAVPPPPRILSSFSPRSSSFSPSSSLSLSKPLPDHLLRFRLLRGTSLGFLNALPETPQHVPLGHSFAPSAHLADIN